MFIKTCKRCSIKKPLSEFYRNSQTIDGRHSHCKSCAKSISKKRREENPIATKESQREAHLKYTFGITYQEYEELLLKQGGVCAICKRPPLNKRLAIDHCHITGEIRGLLCQPCNTGLGLLGDTREAVEKVLKYLGETH